MNAAWLPHGVGRIGFVALALAAGLVAWRSFDATPLPPRPASGADPAIGRILDLSPTTLLPAHAGPPARDGLPAPAARHLVNLFASWCIPCRVEAPVLAKLAARGIRIEGVAVRDEPAAAARFLRQYGDPYSDVRLDRQGQVQAALGVAGLPETYVVDAGGRIVDRFRGALGPDAAAVLASGSQGVSASRRGDTAPR